MKTLLITLEYPPFKGGVSNYYGNLIKHWTAGAEIFVLSDNEHKLLSRWLFPKWLTALIALYREIRKNKIDHVIVGQLLPLGTVAYLITKITKTPYTVFIHGMDIIYAQKTARKRNISRKILNRAVNIICASGYTAELTIKFLGTESTDRIKVVNPGIDPLTTPDPEIIARIRAKHRLFNKIVLFSVGRLVKRKGFDKIIETMPEITKAVPELYYFIAGDGPDKKYLYDRARGVPNIVFLGKISDDEKWAWLMACDIFITVARDIDGDLEGFGIVYLEAGLAGKPVIAGDSGGVKDAVKGAYSGILVDPENAERIAGAVISLARDPKLRQQLGGQGRQRVLHKFGWKDKIREIYDIINNKNKL